MATKLKKQPRWKVAVEVTSGGIKLGVKESAGKCPIARALKYLKFGKVGIDGEFADFTYKGVKYNAALPKAAQKFIERFDEGRTVKPFTFSLYPEKCWA
jgi:hypothetical protein